MPPVCAPRKNRRSTLLERRYAVALREDAGLSYVEISRVTGFSRRFLKSWSEPEDARRKNEYLCKYREKNRERLNAYKRRYYAKNQEKESERRAVLKKENPWAGRFAALLSRSRKLGNTLLTFSCQDVIDRYELCGGKCELCGAKKEMKLHTDHCHVSGRLRGMLCNRCNSALGVVDEVGLRRLEGYLNG